ncbi:MAG: inosine-uridine preferring nucleoside hydrolase [Nitrospira sp. OLB3]|nr:MAG: inosine-uridine preferring nucleoside hydrolase [Nitrospira sp. OLB3]RIK56507.1 MAG: nucleoside hydrolase [Nitrospira sp.]
MPRCVPTRVIIDTDPGADDALAILLALASPELEVVGLTTVCGNVPVGQATKNLFRLLGLRSTLRGLSVGQGAARPLEEDLVTADHVHGSDGLGELDRLLTAQGTPLYPPARLPTLLPTAHEVWNECVRRYPQGLTLITIGPLTNLAVALKVNPLLVQRFQSVIVMGGAIGVPGNVSPVAEFNIYADPHAAARVFQASLPITLVPLDVTTRLSVTRDVLATWVTASRDPFSRLVTDVTGCAFDFAEQVEGHGLFHFHDPLAVLAAVDASLLKLEPLHVSVETRGIVARGMTVADRRSRKAEQKVMPNMQVAVGVDVERSLDLLRARLCPWS